MDVKVGIIEAFVIITLLGSCIEVQSQHANTIDNGIEELWKPCFKGDELFQKHARHCGVEAVGLCGCYNNMACCINITTSIPKLPKTIQKLACRNCFNKTLNGSAFADITSLGLTHLDVSSSRLKVVNDNALDGFRHLNVLEELDFSDNKLVHIPTLCKDKHIFPNLIRLSFHKNMLEGLRVGPFDCFGNLTSLNIGKNRIKALDFQVFGALTKLVNLDLHSNWISNISNVNESLRALRYLNLSKNEFALFPPNLCGADTARVDSFPNLVHLNLGANLITIPWNASWDCMGNLRVLNLTANPIRRLLTNTFANLTSLEELLIADVFTPIDQVQAAAFTNRNMWKLNISNNHINFKQKPAIRGIFRYIPNITELDVSGNVFEDLERNISDILKPMKRLEKLFLMRCKLQTLPANLLRTFHNITLLNMNSNHINSRRIVYSYNDSKLEYLYLANNKIHSLDPSWLAGHMQTTLKQIDLSNNPIDCACDDKSTRKLRQYIVEDNKGGHMEAHFGTVKILNWPAGYVCDSPTSRVGTLFRDFNPEKECTDPDFKMYAFIIVGCCVFVFVVITAVVYRNIWYVKYWIYKFKKQPGRRRNPSRTNGSEQEPLLDIPDEVKRDVFVINHDRDDKFVLTDFQGILEIQMGYSSCIYTRNCCSGAKLDLMVEGIYSSMHTIAVISASFLKDPWCLFQLDVAFDRRVREKRSSLMLVLLEDIDFQSLNKYWCIMLTKTPTAHWCATRNDIRRKLFEEQIEKQLGVPVSKRYHRALSAP